MLQEEALDLLKSGENVFLTGAAGTGKTYVLCKFIDYLKQNKISYSVTASTGLAATHLSGNTIHSWSGIGIRDKISEYDVNNLSDRIKFNYQITRVLIIDEISMLHAHQLDMIDLIARTLLDNNKPFGGIQIVLCGDFCQLPPVSNDNKKEVIFSYESDAWVNSNLYICYLDKQYRQTSSDDLIGILNAIRNNDVTGDLRYKLRDLTSNSLGGNFTKLYTTNTDVDVINSNELKKIDSKSYTFKMREYGDSLEVNSLKKRCLAKEVLELKVGAFVMFIQNDKEKRYVNGTLGVVIGFTGWKIPIVKTRDGDEISVTLGEWQTEDDGGVVASITQLPLTLAWAITVHKSQGMTLDAAEIDLRNAFCYGLGYVALSRVRDLSGIKLLGFNEKALQIDPKMLAQDKIFKGVK